ncbi:MAG TPA: hypothetical protein VF619_07860 [Allosphingosinicella sp.]|jgi:hypothetical protein
MAMTAARELALSAAAVLDAAAICQSRPAAEEAVYLAALALPGLSYQDCAGLALGARDRALAGMREATFGAALSLRAACPACGEAIDVATTTADLLVEEGKGGEVMVEIAGLDFAVRPATSADLAILADIADPAAARETLARRCLVPLGEYPVPEALDAAETDSVGAALATADPAADLFVALRCFECGAPWDAPIDMARILAADITAASEMLIDDIHELAAAYHWSEAQILALAPERRLAYLKRLRG